LALIQDSIGRGRSGPARPDLPSLFLFPGMGGYDPNLAQVDAACRELARTVHVAYPPWRSLLRDSSFDFDALVDGAMAQIAACAPAGPVLLAGYSFGGIVAFVAATRLRAAGRAVGFLGLIDIEARPGIDAATGMPRLPMTRRQELVGFLGALRRGEGSGRLAYVVARRLTSPRWAPVLRFYAGIPQSWLPRTFAVYLDRDLLCWRIKPMLHRWEDLCEAVPPLHAPVVLLRTGQHAANAPRHLGWERCCPDLTVVPVPGTHHDLLGPANLPALCSAFTQAVRRALVCEGSP